MCIRDREEVDPLVNLVDAIADRDLVYEATVDANEADQVRISLDELNRSLFAKEQAKGNDEVAGANVVKEPKAGLLPWREVIRPHDDVSSGTFSVAEFAADVGWVRKGKGSPEYTSPSLFFERAYRTVGLGELLTLAVKRVSGQGGQPVINCQTNFGGGKTHSMLALYHLFSGAAPGALLDIVPEDPGLDELKFVLVIAEQFSKSRIVEKQAPGLVHDQYRGRTELQHPKKATFLLGDRPASGAEQPGESREVTLVDHPTEIGGLLRVLAVELGDRRGEAVDQAITYGTFHQHVVRGDAGLPGVEELTPGNSAGGHIEIGVGSHDGGALATQLEGDGREVLSRSPHDDTTDVGGAREEDVVEGQLQQRRGLRDAALHHLSLIHI